MNFHFGEFQSFGGYPHRYGPVSASSPMDIPVRCARIYSRNHYNRQ